MPCGCRVQLDITAESVSSDTTHPGSGARGVRVESRLTWLNSMVLCTPTYAPLLPSMCKAPPPIHLAG